MAALISTYCAIIGVRRWASDVADLERGASLVMGSETSKSSAAVHHASRDRLGTNLVKLSKNMIIAPSVCAVKVRDLAVNETKLRQSP